MKVMLIASHLLAIKPGWRNRTKKLSRNKILEGRRQVHNSKKKRKKAPVIS